MSTRSRKLAPPVTTTTIDFRRRLEQYRPNILQGYLLTQNLFLIGLCLGVGSCIYLLQDLVENLDVFVQADVAVDVMLAFFLAKLPLILSQILPAAYLVSLIVQIGLLIRHKELLALQAGGVSYAALVRFFAIYGLIWCLLQLFLAQGLGVVGQRAMDRIWQEDVKKQPVGLVEVQNIWFLNGPYVVSVGGAYPEEGEGRDITVYVYGEGNTLQQIIAAKTFLVRAQEWELQSVRVYETISFEVYERTSLVLGITQDLVAFNVLQTRFDASGLSLFELGKVISYLEGTGSNVERLRTAWHMKWAYAFSLLAMTFIALALFTIFDSVYVNIAVGLAIVFVYYVVFVLGATLGEQGFIHPFFGAWLGNLFFGFLAGARLIWHFMPYDLSPVHLKR